jgi:pyruvate dehydrogenase E1 component beta subunit
MSTRRLGIAEALREAIAEEMRRDKSVFCIGEDIGIPGGWGGAFTVTLGLEKEFADRMVNTPISEAGLMGAALGAAMMGMRPIADVQYADFLFCAMDQVANQVAKMRYMSGGKLTVPMVMRAPVGVTGRGAQHAQMMEPFFLPLPGIKIVAPSTAYDAKGLLKAAVRDGNPVLIFEHKLLYGSKGPRTETGSVDASSDIPDGDYTVPIGKGVVRREGTDVTIIATLLMAHRAMEAATILAKEGISAEVIDPRSLVPFDWDLVKGSVAKTGRVVTVEESPKRGGLGGEIAATLAEEMIDYLIAPAKRVAAPNTPAPFSPPMERFYVPDANRIAQAARDLIAMS